ncbi:DUF480 domain-containing protein [Thalassotalea sp. G2M2-11]|uniref:YceH family protein n=1 Tax=Thalassotalea sp. G2M2-11 TaxID=2787627 RepID=UPI0019D1C501|nr:DUF480 domain-containing protein [Thalassotalea sp. G2M2-11]
MLVFSPIQCRVIGAMLEKETTTPEQYPLSLHGIMTACNQKSNREPVMSLSESDVQNGVDELINMQQLMEDRQASSRVPKYIHRFCNTEFGDLQFTAQQRAIICVLLLRGAQTPGELRNRTQRLAEFRDVNAVEDTLLQLQDFNGQSLVKKLAREPGKRESRYVHLFTDQEACDQEPFVQSTAALSVEEACDNTSELTSRVSQLEQQVAALTEQVISLKNLIKS